MKRILIAVGIVVIALTSCKPTEKNYRAAYDAAVSKREKTNESLAADGLISEEGPRIQVIAGDSLYFLNERLSVEDGAKPLKSLNVAVAMFKMNTNARSGASALADKGYDASVARASGDKCYVIAGSFDTLEETRGFIKRFRKENKSYAYIGLDGHPVVIRN